MTKATTELEAELDVEFVLPLTANVPAVMADASEVEALFVLLLTAVVTPEVCVLVFVLTANVPAEIAAASDEEAVFVLALTAVVTPEIFVPKEVEAARTVEFVLPLTANVPAVMAAASDVEAVFVLALTKATTELEA